MKNTNIKTEKPKAQIIIKHVYIGQVEIQKAFEEILKKAIQKAA